MEPVWRPCESQLMPMEMLPEYANIGPNYNTIFCHCVCFKLAYFGSITNTIKFLLLQIVLMSFPTKYSPWKWLRCECYPVRSGSYHFDYCHHCWLVWFHTCHQNNGSWRQPTYRKYDNRFSWTYLVWLVFYWLICNLEGISCRIGSKLL